MDTFVTDDVRRQQVAGLLRQTGLRGNFRLAALDGGANNRVFRVELPETRLLYKEYFHHPEDPRNRLRNEYSFVSFAWHNGIRALPMPLCQDPARHCALYEYIPGRKLKPNEVTKDVVQDALQFFEQVNCFKNRDEALILPLASEACFTLTEHCHCVERRIARLQQIEPAAPVDQAALDLVKKEMTPAWESVFEAVHDHAVVLGLETTPLAGEDRCLSPSDFGFHNALATAEGSIKFIDFEYAGWDDPAKTVCDFFCQPECPVPLEHFDWFARAVVRTLSEPKLHLERFRLLLPVYRAKWCCIMLNDFLPAGGSRRRFARARVDETKRKENQLAKVRRALAQLQPPLAA